LVALPALVSALVWLVAGGIHPERRIEPARCAAGAPVRVSVRLSGWPIRLGLDRLLDVAVEPGLGTAGSQSRPRTEAAPGAASLLIAVRGDHQLPPVSITVGDPFGLARRSRTGGGDAQLLVVPLAPALERPLLGAHASGWGVRRRGADPGFGELDRVREYQAGDSLSRVHWAQTAKRGRLQTKEMRSAEGAGRSVLLLLDGAVAAGDDFEVTVTAAAALARHFAEGRDPVTLVLTGRTPVRIPAARATWPVAEIALARIAPGGARTLALALRAEAAAQGAPDLIIVLTCGAETGLVSAAAQARAAGVGVAAVLAGPAAAAAGDLAAAGVRVVVVPALDRVATALSGQGGRARAS
jgi:uncharacterized protein (DUF58 family)